MVINEKPEKMRYSSYIDAPINLSKMIDNVLQENCHVVKEMVDQQSQIHDGAKGRTSLYCFNIYVYMICSIFLNTDYKR